jgi:hypothetical protein
MKIKLLTITLTTFLCLSCSSKSWRDASRESANIAPKAEELNEDIVQIYYARAYSWRGWFGVHPWIAWKKKEEKSYTVAQVTAWNIRRYKTAISVAKDLPDRNWFDNSPTLIFHSRGEKTRPIIDKIEKLIVKYPYKKTYRIWPGPNSNTFVSYIIRNIDEIKIELPPHAIGKDYLAPDEYLVKSPSQTGYQFSLLGAFGLTIGAKDGVEINILGMNFGADFWTPALRLPFIGRLGFPEKTN